MKLYVLRHALPEDGDGEDYEANPDPPLSDDGREHATALAQWMLETEVVPNFIWSSPKLRCQETAEIVRDVLGLPQVETKGSMGSDMSIRKMVLKACGDKAVTRLLIVSHHESIEHGLRVLNLEPWIHLDVFAMSELRQYRVDRKDGTWEEHMRMLPSDLGGQDHY